jgi:hypothetical protein
MMANIMMWTSLSVQVSWKSPEVGKEEPGNTRRTVEIINHTMAGI